MDMGVCKDIQNEIKPKAVCIIFLYCSEMVSNKSEQLSSMITTTALIGMIFINGIILFFFVTLL